MSTKIIYNFYISNINACEIKNMQIKFHLQVKHFAIWLLYP